MIYLKRIAVILLNILGAIIMLLNLLLSPLLGIAFIIYYIATGKSVSLFYPLARYAEFTFDFSKYVDSKK